MPRKVANGEALRSIRELAGFSQMAFAEQIGVSRPALAKVEAGGGMKIRNLKSAAGALGVPITSLMTTAYEPPEACQALGIDREELDRLIEDGELATVAGGCVSETALEEYIASRLPAVTA